VRYSRHDAGAGIVPTHYTRSVLSLHGTKGAFGFLADHDCKRTAEWLARSAAQGARAGTVATNQAGPEAGGWLLQGLPSDEITAEGLAVTQHYHIPTDSYEITDSE
jgi:hypothetical protein